MKYYYDAPPKIFKMTITSSSKLKNERKALNKCESMIKFLVQLKTSGRWRIQGRGLGGPTPLFLDQTEARRVEKYIFVKLPSPHPRVWMTAAPVIWRSGSATVFYAC